MSTPIALTDEEMDAVLQAAAPIDPAQRDAFLRDIAIELAKCPEGLGPGSVFRTVREVQRRYVVAPLRTGDAIGGGHQCAVVGRICDRDGGVWTGLYRQVLAALVRRPALPRAARRQRR